MSDFIGSGIAFPLRLDARGTVELVRGYEDVEEAIGLILATAPGERPMRPEFGCGIHNHIFGGLDAASLNEMELAIRVALDRWEPRIDVAGVQFNLERADAGELQIEITYVLRATNDRRNLVYPFYVIPAEETA
jgi:phage baseplate assembly protein W